MVRVAQHCDAVKTSSETIQFRPVGWLATQDGRPISPSPSPPLAKKKGSPPTPLKEKTQPLHIPVPWTPRREVETPIERKRKRLATSVVEGKTFHKQRQQSRLARKDSSLTLKGNPEQAEEIPQAANQNPRGEIPNQATSLPPGPNPHRSLPHAHVGGRP